MKSWLVALKPAGSNRKLLGRLQVAVSAIGFGTLGLFARLGQHEGLDAASLLTLRFLVAALALWGYFSLFDRPSLRITRKEMATCAALGLAGYGIFSTFFFKAFEAAPASTVSLLFFSYPVFVILLDWLILREQPDRQIRIGALVISAGLVIGVSASATSGWSAGLLYALAGSAWYAAYVIATRRLLQGSRPQTVALYVISFAAMGFVGLGGLRFSLLSALSGRAWMVVLGIGLLSTVIAILSFYAGLEKLGSAEAAQIGTFELIISLTLSTLLLGEHLSLSLLVGASLALIGIVLGQLKPDSRPPDEADEIVC